MRSDDGVVHGHRGRRPGSDAAEGCVPGFAARLPASSHEDGYDASSQEGAAEDAAEVFSERAAARPPASLQEDAAEDAADG